MIDDIAVTVIGGILLAILIGLGKLVWEKISKNKDYFMHRRRKRAIRSPNSPKNDQTSAENKKFAITCRIGITMDPERRKKEWKQKYPTLRDWTILGVHKIKSAAQTQSTAEAKRLGCAYNPSGAGPEVATWYVYYFQH